jgi:hypothetical protein
LLPSEGKNVFGDWSEVEFSVSHFCLGSEKRKLQTVWEDRENETDCESREKGEEDWRNRGFYGKHSKNERKIVGKLRRNLRFRLFEFHFMTALE